MIRIPLSFGKIGIEEFQNLLEGITTLLWNVLYLI